MKLESITCNHCGAPLDVPESANFVTCTHCNRRLAIRRTENSRFTEVVEDLHDQVSRLTQQNDVAALDREWEIEKEQYLITDKHGAKHVPTRGESIAGGVILTIFGMIWTASACGMSGTATLMSGGLFGFTLLFPLFGVCFVIAGLCFATSAYGKAGKYETAYSDYRARRRQLESGQSETDPQAG